ncbi:hypothetical protein PTI98_010785 [Pleurotus ostreatus]|nr:hypothetical protein PTI98_010785 [Pleurotus ostreatus]
MHPPTPTVTCRATTSTPNKPRSTRSATKALQEALSEDLPVQVKQVKKTPKTNKKTKTSANRDEEDEEAEEPTVQKMTAILSESGAALAPPPRRAGTGVLLPPVAPRIVSTRVRRADPGDVPQVVDKGKGRDLTNLGSSDAEDEPEDNDEEEEDQEEEKKLSDEGPGDMDDDEEKEKTSSEEEKEKMLSDEVSNAGDDKSSDTGDDAMDLDSNITPRNLPASKRQASASPITHRHVAQRSKADHANNTPLPAPVFAGFNDMPSSPIADDFNDLQGASRTMGGVARAKGHGVAPNMADFNTQQADLVPIHNEGRVLVYKHEDRTIAKPRAVRIPLAYTLGPVLKAMVKKMTALADSDISLWVNDDWEMKGPFAVAIEGDEPVEWDNNKEMELLMVSKFRLDLKKILTLSHSGTLNPRLWLPPPSVTSVDAPSTISSLAPSASVSTAGADTASLTISQQLTTAFSDPALLQLAIMLKVPYSMTPKASQKGEILQIYARMKAAAQVPAKWLELKNAGKWMLK